jgi:hypothetical protein
LATKYTCWLERAMPRDRYWLTRPVEHLTIPATIHAILAARIDRLAPEAKRLLQAAAVIGKDVPMQLLLAIADAPEPEVRAELNRLQTAEFLSVDGDDLPLSRTDRRGRQPRPRGAGAHPPAGGSGKRGPCPLPRT